MKSIYSAADSLLVNHLRNLLQSQGIQCEVKNQVLSGAAGELPPTDCWPELWVSEDSQAAKAEQIIKTALNTEEPAGPPWICHQCGEQMEAQFAQCWQCGAARSEKG